MIGWGEGRAEQARMSADAVEGKPEFCGWMVKRGGVRKNWARRFEIALQVRKERMKYDKDFVAGS